MEKFPVLQIPQSNVKSEIQERCTMERESCWFEISHLQLAASQQSWGESTLLFTVCTTTVQMVYTHTHTSPQLQVIITFVPDSNTPPQVKQPAQYLQLNIERLSYWHIGRIESSLSLHNIHLCKVLCYLHLQHLMYIMSISPHPPHAAPPSALSTHQHGPLGGIHLSTLSLY